MDAPHGVTDPRRAKLRRVSSWANPWTKIAAMGQGRVGSNVLEGGGRLSRTLGGGLCGGVEQGF
jgi:hypothetical protein